MHSTTAEMTDLSVDEWNGHPVVIEQFVAQETKLVQRLANTTVTNTLQHCTHCRNNQYAKGAITGKIKHAIKHKTSPARLAQLLHNCCSPH